MTYEAHASEFSRLGRVRVLKARRTGFRCLCDMAMRDDPIVAEVRAIRDKLAAECGYDVKGIFRRARQRQAESGVEYVSCSLRRVAPQQDAAGLLADDDAKRNHGV